jgi:hypothetical protein
MIFFGIFLMMCVDAAKFSQRQASMTNLITGESKKEYVANTNDYIVTTYPATTIKNEPYLIYKQQSMIETLLLLVGLVALGIFFQFGYYGYEVVRADYYQLDPPKGLPIDPENMWILMLILVITMGGMCLNVYYKSMFIGGVIPGLQAQRESLRSLRTHVIRNLPIRANPKLDTTFWTHELKNLDTNALAIRIGNLLRDQTDKRSSDVRLAQKIIFAYNLKTYMNTYHGGKLAIDDDPHYKDLQGLFSEEGYKLKYDIVKLLRVTKSFNVSPLAQYHTIGKNNTSLEARIRAQLRAPSTTGTATTSTGTTTTGTATTSTTATTTGTTSTATTTTGTPSGTCTLDDPFGIFHNEATSMMNSKLDTIRKLGAGKNSLFTFIGGAIGIAAFFIVLCIFVVAQYKWDVIKPYWDGFMTYLKFFWFKKKNTEAEV